MAKRVFLKHINEDNSIIVNCYDPENYTQYSVDEKWKNLHNIAVSKLSAAFHTI